MEKTVATITLIMTLLLTTAAGTVLSSSSVPEKFYLGVTYCGDSVSEAKQLVDKVKGYTNLFVLQSGELQNDTNAVNEIGDYVTNSGLSFITYFGIDSAWLMKTWLDTYDGHWGDRFLGVYFGDEPGGKMLDSEMAIYDQETQSSLRKMADRTIYGYKIDANTSVTYNGDGTIVTTDVDSPEYSSIISGDPIFLQDFSFTTYFPDGRVTLTTQKVGSSEKVVENISDAPYTYEQLWDARPFQSYDETAQKFVKEISFRIDIASRYNSQVDYEFFTSDYGLYWFDYLAGYDVVFAQFGWNQSIVQNIGLARGAANFQGKDWGAIITWKYTQEPYLDRGDEIFQQMCLAYESGARYIVIFNYAEDMQDCYGTLKDEHFQALERFWKEEVQSSTVVNGGKKGEVALILPRSYGWGMRFPEDNIWGLWDADEKSEQIWGLCSVLIEDYGANLDIVYDDPAYPFEAKYAQIFYAFEKEIEPFPTIPIATVVSLSVAVACLGLVVYFRKRKR